MKIPRNRLARLTAGQVITLRLSRNLTQAQFAKLVGVSCTSVCHWETGRFRAPADLEAKLAAISEQAAKRLREEERLHKEALEDVQYALSEYRKLRKHFGHSDIVALWAKSKYQPSKEAQQLIAEAYPDVLEEGTRRLLDKAFALPLSLPKTLSQPSTATLMVTTETTNSPQTTLSTELSGAY